MNIPRAFEVLYETALPSEEFKALWLQWLTDGTYRRLTGKLVSSQDDKQRCCLGVALAALEELNADKLPMEAYVGRGVIREHEACMVGLTFDDQLRLSTINDNAIMEPDKEYEYPARIIDIIKTLPVKEGATSKAKEPIKKLVKELEPA